MAGAASRRRGVRRQYTHAIDIVPTLYECLGVELPETVKGYTQHPLEGISFAATFDDADATTGKETQFYSMLGTRAIWHQGWKAGALSPAAPDAWADFSQQRWELFDTDERSERVPRPRRAAAGAGCRSSSRCGGPRPGQYQALPLESRGALGDPDTPRPAALQAPQPLRVLPGLRRGAGVGGAEHPQPLVHDRGRGRDRHAPTRSGVLFAQGSRFGGHALYIKDGKLKYVYNWVGELEQIIESTEPIPTGHVVVSASFEKEGDAMPTEGTLTLHIRDQAVGAGQDQDPAGQVLLAGEGLNVGKDGGEPVTDDYPGQAPWPFIGGTINGRSSTSAASRSSTWPPRPGWPSSATETKDGADGSTHRVPGGWPGGCPSFRGCPGTSAAGWPGDAIAGSRSGDC